jgi:hypothetical protein
VQQHFGAECPARSICVRGEAPPGWWVDAQGWSVKDEVAWNGPELTDTARNRYRDLVGIVANFSLLAHSTFTISVDVIAGESQVLPRCSLLPPFGRWRGRWLGDEHAGASSLEFRAAFAAQCMGRSTIIRSAVRLLH